MIGPLCRTPAGEVSIGQQVYFNASRPCWVTVSGLSRDGRYLYGRNDKGKVRSIDVLTVTRVRWKESS